MVKVGDKVKILSQFLPFKQKYVGEAGVVIYVSQFDLEGIDVVMADGSTVTCENISEYAIINEEVI